MLYFSIGLGVLVGIGTYLLFVSSPTRLPKTPETDMQIAFLAMIFGVFAFVFPYALEKNRRTKGRRRKGFTDEQKMIVRNRQGGICLHCNMRPPIWEYHHRDGNRNNNRTSNCEAICPTCHAILERE